MDAKRLIQLAWPLEAAAVIVYMGFSFYLMDKERLQMLVSFLPLFAQVILSQGLVAWTGPEIRRLIESKGVSAPVAAVAATAPVAAVARVAEVAEVARVAQTAEQNAALLQKMDEPGR